MGVYSKWQSKTFIHMYLKGQRDSGLKRFDLGPHMNRQKRFLEIYFVCEKIFDRKVRDYADNRFFL